MALLKLEDFEPNYRETFGNNDIKGFEIYVEGTKEKIGFVSDILVDEFGYFRYLIIDFGLWIFNKKVLLPVGHSRIEANVQRVYVLGLDRKQTENLLEHNDRVLAMLDYRDTNDYQQNPALYDLNDRNHQILKQCQDRLIAKKNRNNPDEAVLVQQVEAEVNQVEVLAEKEQAVTPQPQPVDPEAEVSASGKATRSACLIFNPVAGQSDPEQDLAMIQRILQPKLNLDIRTTTPDVDADQLAREAVEQGAEIIIASGGDGTLSAAAEALIGTSVPLGVISRGTANAFATALGIPTTIEAACKTILGGITRVVDAAYCNGKPMVLLAGIGFEAKTVERTDRGAKDRFGMLAYVLAGFQELRELKPFSARIETEDRIITLDAVAVTIANAAPPTSILAQGPAALIADDGLLDVTLVAPVNRVGAIAAAYNLLQSAGSDATTNQPNIGYLRARRIKVTTNPPQQVVLDGELIGNPPVEIECIPGGLTIFVDSAKAPTENLESLPNLHVELKEPKAGG